MKHLLVFIAALLPLVLTAQIETPGSGAGGGGGGGSSTNLLWANTLFVDSVNGDDSTAIRGDAAKPWKTATNAFGNLQSGDTLLFRPGTHTVTMRGFDTNAAMYLRGKSNITIAGLSGARLKASDLGTMFVIKQATNIVFKDLELVGIKASTQTVDSGSAVMSDGMCSRIRFFNVSFRDWHNHAISSWSRDLTWGNDDWIISGCSFYNIGTVYGYTAQTRDGTAVTVVGDNVLVEGNYFYDCWRGYETYQNPFYTNGYYSCRNHVLKDNIFERIREYAVIAMHTNNIDWSVSGNHFIAYNTNYHSGSDSNQLIRWAFNITQARNWKISDNYFHGWDKVLYVPPESTTPISDFVFENNVVENIDSTAVYVLNNRYYAGSATNKNLAVKNNTFRNVTDGAVVVNMNDFEVTGNTFMDCKATTWGALAVGYHPSDGTSNVVTILTSNAIIGGNIFGNRTASGGTGATITIGTASQGAKVFNNQILAGSAINNLGTNTTFYPDSVNTSQFANSSTVTIKDTPLVTNLWVYGNNTNALRISSGVITSGLPALDISQTWSNSGVAFIGLSLNATNIAASSSSRLIDAKLTGTSVFSVETNGNVNIGKTSPSFSDEAKLRLNGASTVDLVASANNAEIRIAGATWLKFGANMSPVGFSIVRQTDAFGWGYDTYFYRDSAASIQMGADAATATTQTIKAHDGSGTDKAGADFNISAGQGTGTGAGGTINFRTAPAGGASSSSVNSYVTRMSIDSTGLITAFTLASSNLTYLPKTLTASTNVTVDLAAGSMQSLTITADTTLAVTNVGIGRNVSLFVNMTNANEYKLIMPSGIRLYSGAVTNTVTTNKSAVISFTSFDGISSNLVTTVAIEP